MDYSIVLLLCSLSLQIPDQAPPIDQAPPLAVLPPQAPEVDQAPSPLTYEEAVNLAKKTSKPLIIWIGKAICPNCVAETKDEFVHFFAASHPSFPADSLTVGLREGDEILMVGQVKETTWAKSGGHIATVRKILRIWDTPGRAKTTITDTHLYSAPAKIYQSQSYFQSGYQINRMNVPMYTGMMFSPGRYMSGGRACAT